MTEEQQERILAWVVQSPTREMLFPFLSETFFESPRQRAVYSIIQAIWDRRKSIPTKREMRSLLKKWSSKETELVRMDWLDRVDGLYSLPVTGATMEELAEQITRYELLQVATESVTDKPIRDLIKDIRKKTDGLSSLLQASSREDETVCMLSSSYLKSREEQMANAPDNGISLGFERIDQATGGMLRGELVVVMAPSNTGKTMFLVNVAANLLEQGLKVLFINCDTVKDIVERRLYARLTGISMNKEVGVQELHEAVQSWMDTSKYEEGNFLYRDIVPNTTTVSTIRGMLHQIDDKYGERDVVIIDYGDLILPDTKSNEKRHALADAFEGLRGLGRDMNKLVVTATQSNRSGLDKHKDEVITMKNASEAYAKFFPCSLGLAINQTAAERTFTPPVCRLSVLKNTKGERDFVVPFVMDYERATMRYDTDGYVQKVLNLSEDESSSYKPKDVKDKPSVKIGSTKYKPKIKPAEYKNKGVEGVDYLPEPDDEP
jgi:replicative DNA helicase